MNLALKQNNSGLKLSSIANSKPLSKPRYSTEEQFQEDESEEICEEDCDAFNVTITERRTDEPQVRTIKRSVVNRSCLNTLTLSCKDLEAVPLQLSQNGFPHLPHLQKIDLSFNNISDIHVICFSQMHSLKELILNDNNISELPFSEINQCRALKLINISNNRLYILPPLTRPSYIEARLNPLRLVTAQLVRLSQIQFVTFDWLDYLLEGSKGVADRFKQNTLEYAKFKAQILEKINYENEQNSTYCDFHSYFSVRLQQVAKRPKGEIYLSALIVKAMHRDDRFFISYLKNYQNSLNYAKMTYSCKLLLQIALENNYKEVIDLFMLKKTSFAEQVNQQIYFESLRLACRYSHIEMFEFLVSIRNQKKRMQTKYNISMLIDQLLQRYDKEKQSLRILHSLTNMYKETNSSKFLIRLPQEFNSKVYKSVSRAILDVYLTPSLQPYFEIEATDTNNSKPLDFAMKSRNEELLKEFLKEDWDLFERNSRGVACKFTYGATQISRKLVWKKEKQLIKRQWRTSKQTDRQIVPSNKCSRQTIEYNPSRIQIDLNESSESLGKSVRQPTDSRRIIFEKPLSLSQSRQVVQDNLLPFLFVRAKEFMNLSWQKDFSKKMSCLNGFVGGLQRLEKHKEESMMKRLQLWKKITDKLNSIYLTIDDEDPLLLFELVQTAERIDGIREDCSPPTIKVEGQKASIQNPGFWCCRDLSDDN